MPLLATANTTTLIELHSSQDGVYYLEVTRLVADVIDIQLQSFDLHLVPTPLTLIPSFTFGLYIYHANYPYGGKSALVSVTTTVEPTTATITIDHSGTPIALLYPLDTEYHFNSTLDGQYFIILHRLPPDIIGVNFQVFDGTVMISSGGVVGAISPPINYVGGVTGSTVGQARINFQAYQPFYTFVLPTSIPVSMSSLITPRAVVVPLIQRQLHHSF